MQTARPLLEVLGSTIFVVGDRPGQGQSVKVINNLMSACSIAITSEAAALGVKAGLDPKTLLEVVSASSGANAAASTKFPQYVLTRTFHQGFRLELMAKDVRLALAEARRHGVPMVLGVDRRAALERWRGEPRAGRRFHGDRPVVRALVRGSDRQPRVA